MSLKKLFTIHSIIALVFGISFLAFPAEVVNIYGGTLGIAGVFIGRLFGVTLLTVGLVAWFARDSHDSIAQRALVLGFAISFVIAAIISAQGVLSGAVNALGWGTVALYVFLAFFYGKFAMKQEGEVS